MSLIEDPGEDLPQNQMRSVLYHIDSEPSNNRNKTMDCSPNTSKNAPDLDKSHTYTASTGGAKRVIFIRRSCHWQHTVVPPVCSLYGMCCAMQYTHFRTTNVARLTGRPLSSWRNEA
jgi:hypothetical protein